MRYLKDFMMDLIRKIKNTLQNNFKVENEENSV